MMHGVDHETLYTPDEVADRLRISRRTLTRMVKDGRIPAVRVTSTIIRFRAKDVDALVSPEAVA